MAKMEIGGKRLKLDGDGSVGLADAPEMGTVGQIMRDPESGKWVARAADDAGKIGRSKTEHATRQAAFEAILRARGLS